MEEIKKVQTIPIKHSLTTYKMIIPNSVEKKIRLLCREIPNVEWSGVLFYKIDGSFENNDLVITCLDIFQMDEGSAAYTEFSMSPDVCSYICDHPELAQSTVYQALVHSHNHMTSFFSTTDVNTLQSEGNDTNHFVSLIVNNAGKYTAGITRKIKSTKYIKEHISYNTWNDITIDCDDNTYTESEDYIQWFNLDIEVERDTEDYEEEMLSRILEIRDSKRKSSYSSKYFNNANFNDGYYSHFDTPVKRDAPYVSKDSSKIFLENGKSGESIKSQTLFTDSMYSVDTDDYKIPYTDFQLNKDIVDKVVLQTVTCSAIIANGNSVNIERWVNSMDSLFTKRFHTIERFEAFANNFVDYLVNFTEDPDLIEVLDSMEMSAILAYQVVIELEKLPSNKWIQTLIKLYKDYIL